MSDSEQQYSEVDEVSEHGYEHGPASQEAQGMADDDDLGPILLNASDLERTLEADHALVAKFQEAVAACQLACSASQTAEIKGQQAGAAAKQARKALRAAHAESKKAGGEHTAASGAQVTAKDAFCQAFVRVFGQVLQLPEASIFPIKDSAGRVWLADTKGVVMDGPCKLAWLRASSPKLDGALGKARHAVSAGIRHRVCVGACRHGVCIRLGKPSRRGTPRVMWVMWVMWDWTHACNVHAQDTAFVITIFAPEQFNTSGTPAQVKKRLRQQVSEIVKRGPRKDVDVALAALRGSVPDQQPAVHVIRGMLARELAQEHRKIVPGSLAVATWDFNTKEWLDFDKVGAHAASHTCCWLRTCVRPFACSFVTVWAAPFSMSAGAGGDAAATRR